MVRAMTIYDIKPQFQNLLRPVCRGLAGAGVTANQVTLAAMALSFAAGSLVAWMPEKRWPLLVIPAVLFVRMALNAIDGMLAREHGMKSAFGGFLNELTDVFSDAALYAPLALVAGFHGWLVLIAVFLAAMTEMTGVVAVQVGASRRYDGPMGKSDRAFVFGVIYFVIGCGLRPGIWTDIALGVVIALLTFTIANRMRSGLKEVLAKKP